MSLSLTCAQQPHMPPLVKHADARRPCSQTPGRPPEPQTVVGRRARCPPAAPLQLDRFLSLRAHEGHLARKLERRLVRLGAAVAKEHLVQVLGGLDHHLC